MELFISCCYTYFLDSKEEKDEEREEEDGEDFRFTNRNFPGFSFWPKGRKTEVRRRERIELIREGKISYRQGE